MVRRLDNWLRCRPYQVQHFCHGDKLPHIIIGIRCLAWQDIFQECAQRSPAEEECPIQLAFLLNHAMVLVADDHWCRVIQGFSYGMSEIFS